MDCYQAYMPPRSEVAALGVSAFDHCLEALIDGIAPYRPELRPCSLAIVHSDHLAYRDIDSKRHFDPSKMKTEPLNVAAQDMAGNIIDGVKDLPQNFLRHVIYVLPFQFFYYIF